MLTCSNSIFNLLVILCSISTVSLFSISWVTMWRTCWVIFSTVNDEDAWDGPTSLGYSTLRVTHVPYVLQYPCPSVPTMSWKIFSKASFVWRGSGILESCSLYSPYNFQILAWKQHTKIKIWDQHAKAHTNKDFTSGSFMSCALMYTLILSVVSPLSLIWNCQTYTS